MTYVETMPFSRFGTHPVSPKDRRDHVLSSYLPTMRAADLPDEVGYLNWELTPPVLNQSEEGSCTGHDYYVVKRVVELRGRTKSRRRSVPQFSPRGAYDLARLEGGYPTEEGAYMRDVLKAASKYGSVRNQDWPYVVQPAGQRVAAEAPKKALRYAKNWKIGSYARLRTLDEMLTSLHTLGPLFAALVLHDSFFETGKDGVVPAPRGQEAGGHAMGIVAASQSRRAFLTQNSWSERWGWNGFCWIGFDHFLGVPSEAWAVPDYAPVI